MKPLENNRIPSSSKADNFAALVYLLFRRLAARPAIAPEVLVANERYSFLEQRPGRSALALQGSIGAVGRKLPLGQRPLLMKAKRTGSRRVARRLARGVAEAALQRLGG